MPSNIRLTRLTAVALVALSLASACKKLDQVDLPTTNPNPPIGALPSSTPGGDVIGRPGGGASPSPTASPGASPGSSPTASPSATQSPSGGSCTLAALPEGSPCTAESPTFLTQVEAAQAEVLRTRPDLFSGDRVRSEDAYVQEVARVLRTRGLCAAQGGPKDEVAVKNNNGFNDQYDIVLGSGQIWTSYQVTCRPARF